MLNNKEKRKLYDKKKAERIKNIIFDFKKNRKCEKCGYNKNPQILHFHHIKQKNKNISQIRSQRALFREIHLCILLCPNCHMELHSD